MNQAQQHHNSDHHVQEGGKQTTAQTHVSSHGPDHAVDKHAGQHTADFLRRFRICLVLTIPILLMSHMIPQWPGYGPEHNLFGRKSNQANCKTIIGGVRYTLPMLIVGEARVDGLGKVRLQLMLGDMPVASRLRFYPCRPITIVIRAWEQDWRLRTNTLGILLHFNQRPPRRQPLLFKTC